MKRKHLEAHLIGDDDEILTIILHGYVNWTFNLKDAEEKPKESRYLCNDLDNGVLEPLG